MEAAESRAFPGWRAVEIHRALNEPAISEETAAVLWRVGRALGEREGTGPEDDSLLGDFGRRERALGIAEGHARGLNTGMAGMAAAILRRRGIAVSEGFAAELAARRGSSPEAVLEAASAAEDEADFLAAWADGGGSSQCGSRCSLVSRSFSDGSRARFGRSSSALLAAVIVWHDAGWAGARTPRASRRLPAGSTRFRSGSSSAWTGSPRLNQAARFEGPPAFRPASPRFVHDLKRSRTRALRLSPGGGAGRLPRSSLQFRGFNEAGARTPRKRSGLVARRAVARARVNEAGARTPRKSPLDARALQ